MVTPVACGGLLFSGTSKRFSFTPSRRRSSSAIGAAVRCRRAWPPCRGGGCGGAPAKERDFGFRGFPQESHADGSQARGHRLANFQLAIAAGPPPWPIRTRMTYSASTGK